MGIEIQTQVVYLDNTTPSPFQFSSAVLQVAYGIIGFYLCYPKDLAHDVQTLGVNVAPSGVNGSEASFKVSGTLCDKGGNTADPGDSWVTVGAIAITSDVGAAAGNTDAINDGGYTPAKSATGQISANCFLSGFDLSYGSGKDHNVLSASASVALSTSGGVTKIGAGATMTDDSGHTAATATASGGFLATTVTTPGFLLSDPQTSYNTGSGRVQFDFSSKLQAGQTLQAATVLMQGFTVAYSSNDDHQINGVLIGLQSNGAAETAWIDSSGKVVLCDALAKWWDVEVDGNQRCQDDTKSSVTLIAVGVPTG